MFSAPTFSSRTAFDNPLKYMKNMLIRSIFAASVILLFAMVYFACDDSGVVTSNELPAYCITGKLAGWIPGDKALYAQIYSRYSSSQYPANCPVDSLGNFNLCLPQLADSILFTADSIFFVACSGGSVTFNPPDVKGSPVISYKVLSQGNPVGYADYATYLRIDSVKSGDYEVQYIYFNKAVTITGTSVCMSDTLTFNGTAAIGWNKMIKHYISVSPSGKTILYDMTDPGTAIWRYHGI
jgi:hypothetical protein